MKRYSNIIKASVFVIIVCMGTAAQAQQKPSERSFASEVNKIKQKQAARNTMINRIPQPTTTVVTSSNEPSGSTQNFKTTTSPTSANNITPAQTGTGPSTPATRSKPSSGPMRQLPKRH